MEIINEAEKAAERDIWSLMQFTENLRRQYGKEPYSMEILLKKLYVRRMAADLGITKIYTSGKMVGMRTNMTEKVFKLIMDSMVSDVHRNSLDLVGDHIKVTFTITFGFGFVMGCTLAFSMDLIPTQGNNYQCTVCCSFFFLFWLLGDKDLSLLSYRGSYLV